MQANTILREIAMKAPKRRSFVRKITLLAWAAVIGVGLVTTAQPVTAGTFSFTGNFTQDDDVRFFIFDIASPSAVTLSTYSYGGGTNAAGQVIPAGGFEPVVSLFEGTGALLGSNGPDGSCPPQSIDSVTGLCVDAFLQQTNLEAGTYFVALTEFFNIPLGPDLSGGFLQAGMGNFTGPEICSDPGGSFLDETCNQRTSFFALDIAGVRRASAIEGTPNPIPEPTSLWLLIGPATLLVVRHVRRRARH